MAYMSQEKKAKLAPVIKNICKKYGLKGTLSVRSNSTLVLTIKSGDLDIIGDAIKVMRTRPHDRFDARNVNYIEKSQYLSVNVYHIDSNYSGICRKALSELKEAMNDGNWDKSDIQSDYFDVGWYIDIHVGSWKKPYVFTGGSVAYESVL